MKAMRLKIFLTSLAALIAFSVRCQACGNFECPPSEYLMYRVYDPSAVMASEREVTHLAESDDPEVKRYLALARSCEKLRNMYTSKWYYPTKGDDVVLSSLEDVLDDALTYKGNQLKDRYALQAARAMFTLGKFKEMIDDITTANFSESLVYQLLHLYNFFVFRTLNPDIFLTRLR